MKYLIRKSIWLMLSMLVFAGQTMAQSKGFSPFVLSIEGKTAYEQLLKVELFAFGGTGFGGGISKGETALDILVKDKQAISAFKNLISAGSPEGGLYALVGLKMLRCDCFNDALSEYKGLAERAEKEDLPSVNGQIDLGALVEKASVKRMSGCFLFHEKRLKVAEDIEKGTDGSIKMAVDNFHAKK